MDIRYINYQHKGEMMFEILADQNFTFASRLVNLNEAFNIWTGAWLGLGAVIIWIICLSSFSKSIILGSLLNTVYLFIGICLSMLIESTSYGTKMIFLIEDGPDLTFQLNTDVFIPESWIYEYNTYYINPEKIAPDVYYLKDQGAIKRVKDGTGYRTNKTMLRFFQGRVYSQDAAYAMHIKTSGKYLFSPYIFTPTSCIAIPLVCSIPAFFFVGSLKNIFE